VVPRRFRIRLRSTVAKTGLMAEGFKRLAVCQPEIKTSPRPTAGWSWLVMAMMTISGLAVL
jgi:hypothetical protein